MYEYCGRGREGKGREETDAMMSRDSRKDEHGCEPHSLHVVPMRSVGSLGCPKGSSRRIVRVATGRGGVTAHGGVGRPFYMTTHWQP